MNTSEQIDQVAAAMAAVQAEMKPALKDATNPHFKSKYADLSSVFEAIRAPLAKNGLTVWQDLGSDERGVTCRTRIAHKSGQWVEFGPLSIPANKQDAQGLGSAATYARRYGLSAALGVVADLDDDGNAAANGNGRVADAQSDPMRDKNPPGRHKAVTAVRELCREVMACEDGDQLMALLNNPENKKLAFTICRDFPKDWQGQEANSGLAGVVMLAAQNLKCTDAETWVHKAEQAVREAQPKAAAE